MSRAASSASMAAICAWIGARAGEPGRARARLAASSRRVRSSSPMVRPAGCCTGRFAGLEPGVDLRLDDYAGAAVIMANEVRSPVFPMVLARK